MSELYHKYTSNNDFYEYIMQNYLIKKKFREIFQIQLCPLLYNSNKLSEFVSFINKQKLKYKIVTNCDKDNLIRFIFFLKNLIKKNR